MSSILVDVGEISEALALLGSFTVNYCYQFCLETLIPKKVEEMDSTAVQALGGVFHPFIYGDWERASATCL